MGLGKELLPETAFATRNFHCGYLADSDQLEKLFHFQRDSLSDIIDRMKNSFSGVERGLASLFKLFVKRNMLKSSEPYQALLKGDIPLLRRFYGLFL